MLQRLELLGEIATHPHGQAFVGNRVVFGGFEHIQSARIPIAEVLKFRLLRQGHLAGQQGRKSYPNFQGVFHDWGF